MKTIIAVILFTLALAISANADSLNLGGEFMNAQKWLEDSRLSLTGGPNGRDDEAAFSQETLVFYGVAAGNKKHDPDGQRGVMAKRAAVVLAQRGLIEYLRGFQLGGISAVVDAKAEADVVVSITEGSAKGSQVVYQEYNKETNEAIAIIKLGMHGPKGFASAYYERMNSDPKLRDAIKTDNMPFKAEAVKLDVMYDGMIIDATDQNFKPALINRIFATKGDVLYDPAKISQKVLVEQGCGEYTKSIDKAKAALATRGVKNPLVIKASGTTSPADLQVTDDDAVIIYSANQKGAFMAAANVAFVLK